MMLIALLCMVADREITMITMCSINHIDITTTPVVTLKYAKSEGAHGRSLLLQHYSLYLYTIYMLGCSWSLWPDYNGRTVRTQHVQSS